MADLIHVKDMRDGYIELLRRVLDRGDYVAPRGMATYEIPDMTVVLEDPAHAVPIDIGRHLSMGIGVAETCQLVAGVSCAWQLQQVSGGTFAQFADAGALRGAYGPRAWVPFYLGLKKLVEDPSTRQAVIPIWHEQELMDPGRDVPCTLALHLTVRRGRLNLTTYMRSNDAWLGVPYDFWMFTRLQGVAAYVLDLEVGTYTHHATSMHVYERNVPSISALRPTPGPPAQIPWLTEGAPYLPDWQKRWDWITREAFITLHGTSDLEWYANILSPHGIGGMPFCSRCRYVMEPVYACPCGRFRPGSGVN